MPLRLEIKRILSASSERVKSCDFHPTEPWILSALFSGHCFIWNYQTQTLVKTFEVSNLPVRVAKFIPKKQWIVCGSDDMQIRVYNYNTMERVFQFEAHSDYIRSIAIHPTLPLVLSCSDDMYIKLWNWEKNWECQHVYEGHTHYVMQVEFNPKDTNTFASASLDRSIKVWGLKSVQPHFTLEGHERGVNTVSYFRGGDMPYIISGADDHLVKVWDYQTKTCVATLDGHTNNVSAVMYHPTLPVIISGSEDGTVRVWHATTYKLENTLNYGLGRVWSIATIKGSNGTAIGYDDGTIMIKLGHEEPVASMEKGGKVVWAKHHEIQIANVKKRLDDVEDGEVLPVISKELGSSDIYPQSIAHAPNGRLLCACGDGEYVIYTALSLKNKAFGQALEFVWGQDNGVYATRESSSAISIFHNFEQAKQFRPPFAAEGIFGGFLLGVRSSDFIDLYDWEEARLIRRIEVCPNKVFWSETGDVVVFATESSFYVLRYNRELVQKFLDQGISIGEQGIDNSLDLEEEVVEQVSTGYFVGDCFIYTNSAGRLNYYVGGEVITLAHLDKPMYLLGYIPKHNRCYLMDKEYNMYSYQLLVSVLVYQTAIVRQDMEAAERALADVPEDQMNKLAHFLEAQGHKELALQVSNDPEHKFELALSLQKLDLARKVILESESEHKWKQLGDLALSEEFDLDLAEECYLKSKDLTSLLLLHTCRGNREGMEQLANLSKEEGISNIGFIANFLLNDPSKCIDLLIDTGRVPEAAFMARTYCPGRISEVLTKWKADLSTVNQRAADSLADPLEFGDKFTNLPWAMKVEQWLNENNRVLPAANYPHVAGYSDRDLIAEMQNGSLQVADVPAPVHISASVKAVAMDEEEEEEEEEEQQQEEEEQQQQQQEEDPMSNMNPDINFADSTMTTNDDLMNMDFVDSNQHETTPPTPAPTPMPNMTSVNTPTPTPAPTAAPVSSAVQPAPAATTDLLDLDFGMGDATPAPQPTTTSYTPQGDVVQNTPQTVEDEFSMFSAMGTAPSATPTLEELDASLAELEDDDAWDI